MTAIAKQACSIEDYLAIDCASDRRHELVNGEIYAMTGGSANDALIAANLIAALGQGLRGKPCRVYSSDLRIHVAESSMFTYPDVSVVCGGLQIAPYGGSESVQNPKLLIEVLSPGTESYDRGEKFAHYRRIASLSDYLLVAQDRIRIERFERRGNEWVLSEASDMASSLSLTSIGCSLAVHDVYSNVDLPANPPARAVNP